MIGVITVITEHLDTIPMGLRIYETDKCSMPRRVENEQLLTSNVKSHENMFHNAVNMYG